MRSRWVPALVLAWSFVLGAPARAGAVLDRVEAGKSVRICIWPDYYGITYRNPRTQQLVGLDIDLAAALGADQGWKLEFVDSSFSDLTRDLLSERCDVAMFAVGMFGERLQQLRFTPPYLRSDIYGITTRSSPVVRKWSDIDRPGVLVGVQAGTYMEPVMASRLRHAKLVSIRAPQSRERELEAGRIDVFMTDYPYSRRLLDNADWAALISPPQPFHVLPYGYAVKPGDERWLALLSDFVARVQKDGRLESLARRHGLEAIVVRP